MKRSDAPWSAEQVASLNAYQQNPGTHPFTGERDAGGGETVLVATRAGWVEREGGPVVQTWAHQCMTDWSWRPERTTTGVDE